MLFKQKINEWDLFFSLMQVIDGSYKHAWITQMSTFIEIVCVQFLPHCCCCCCYTKCFRAITTALQGKLTGIIIIGSEIHFFESLCALHVMTKYLLLLLVRLIMALFGCCGAAVFLFRSLFLLHFEQQTKSKDSTQRNASGFRVLATHTQYMHKCSDPRNNRMHK